MQLGAYLLKAGLVNEEALHACLEEQKVTRERLGLILTRNNLVSRTALLDAILATAPDNISGETFITLRVPLEVLVSTKSMVVAEMGDKVFVCTLGSERQAALEIAPFYPEAELVWVAANHEQVDNYLEEIARMTSSDDSLVDRLMRKAFALDGVSDIHIIPRYSSYSVFFRRHGRKGLVHEGSLDEYNTLAARIKDLSKMDLAERRIPQDGQFSMEFNGKMVDLRVATVPTVNSEALVLRLLDPSRVPDGLNKLGITRVELWRKGISRPDGLCLICGPTGSGKTTTLNATLRELDRFGSAIFTLEDPVEYRLPFVNQVNINPAVGLDFARGIRNFMRADPDVIIVGEIRDAETARNAVKAAETGHLVLGTLHTGSIRGAVQRLRDLDVPGHELTYLLRSVMVQRLMRTLCSHCKGVGCKACSGSGYGARTVISECNYFSSEDDVLRLLDTNDRWWPTLIDDAILKLDQGLTTEREVIRALGDPARVLLDERKAHAGKAVSTEAV